MKKMKKFIAACIILVMVFGLAGCGSNNSNVSSDNIEKIDGAQFKAQDLANYLYSNIEFEDYMENVDTNVLMEIYNLNSDYISDSCSFFSTGATAEEITVVTVTDNGEDTENEISEVIDAYNKRVEAQKESFEDYVPKELDKLSEPLFMEVNNSLILVICNDRDKAKAVIEEYFK